MPPQIPILAQSENKSKFLERLGISDQTEEGKRIYAMMKEEAVAGRARMSASPTSLLPHLLHDPTVKPPYSNTQISESAMHQETIYIYRTARPETRVFYDSGHYMEGDAEENWIIKWLLWHVFRYRDNRNRGRTMPAWIARSSQGPESPGSANGSSQTAQPLSGNTPPPYPPSQQLLPIQYVGHGQASMQFSSATRAQDQTSETRIQSQGYWDPVRDAQRFNQR